MIGEHGRSPIDHDLRRRAEELDQRRAVRPTEDIDSLAIEEIRRRFHDLRVHQIELEMQNEQLRQTQETLEALQARYFDLYDMAPVGYCTISEKGLIQEANLKACTLLAVPRSTLVGQRFSRFIHTTEDSDRYYLLRKQMFAGCGPQECELRMMQWDGTAFWAHLVTTLPQDENGTPISLVTLTDITQRKQAEIALQRHHVLMARTEQIAHFGSWEWNAATATMTWSDELFRIFQLEPTDPAPSFAEHPELYHPADGERLQSSFEHTVKTRKPFELEIRVLRKDGTTRVCLARGQVEAGQESRSSRLVGSLQDITEQKQAEEENKHLQAQLMQEQKMEVIGTLAGGIAHDFNNILGAIFGYAEEMSEVIPPGSLASSHLNKITQAGQRAADLVKQILAFSRQANSERIFLQPGHSIRQTLQLLLPSLPSTITINQSIATSKRFILADPIQVHQILMTLCINALHAMEQTGGTLEIIVEDREVSQENLRSQPGIQPGQFVVISVRDTGLGIDSEVADTMFQSSFTTTRVGKNTGLGLAIVHGIVSSYGGFITCESAIGKGTVFRVFFPAHEQNVAPETKPGDAVPSGTECILFIDNEEMLADSGKRMLERLGYKVLIQTSSLEAFAVFQNHPQRFDAVITDQTMPDLTGMELARQMLQIRPDIPIILCTGYSTLINEELAKKQGIKGFAMKPLHKKVIATLLREVLDASKESSLQRWATLAPKSTHPK